MKRALESSIDDVKIIDLPKVKNRAGNITALSSGIECPFEIKRVYYLYDIPAGEERGGHAHRDLEQYIIAASGSFSIKLTDGNKAKEITLNRPDRAVHLVPGIWRELIDFSSGSICLVIASRHYDENDYIRSLEEFAIFKGQ